MGFLLIFAIVLYLVFEVSMCEHECLAGVFGIHLLAIRPLLVSLSPDKLVYAPLPWYD